MTPADEAFVAFAHAASPRLLRTAWLTCGDHHLAEDLVQGALAAVYQRWGRLRSDDPAAYARRCIINAHIDASQPEWAITLTILLVSDGAAVRTLSAACVPEQCATALTALSQGLVDLACREANAEPELPPPWYLPPPADRWPHSLYARTQTLVVLAAALHKSDGPSLYGDRAILDGILSNAVDQKNDPVARLLLVTALSRHRDTGSPIYHDYEERLRTLQKEHPIRGVTAIPLQEALEALFEKN